VHYILQVDEIMTYDDGSNPIKDSGCPRCTMVTQSIVNILKTMA